MDVHQAESRGVIFETKQYFCTSVIFNKTVELAMQALSDTQQVFFYLRAFLGSLMPDASLHLFIKNREGFDLGLMFLKELIIQLLVIVLSDDIER